jgi:hypothetical protein
VKPKAALVVVDVQNDFISGSLAIINCPAGQNGEDVSAAASRVIIALPNLHHAGGRPNQPAAGLRALQHALLQPRLASLRPRVIH